MDIEQKISEFIVSPNYINMIQGENYYSGLHDILYHKRTVIGKNGKPEELTNLPNARIVDNQYKKMVDQKNNYLVGKPFSWECKNETLDLFLKKIFDRKFMSLLKSIGEDAYNSGITYLFCNPNENGELEFTQLKGKELIPEWEDNSHTKLKSAVRFYYVTEEDKTITTKIEEYTKDGVNYYESKSGSRLKPCEPYHRSYIKINEEGYNWSEIPIIPFKYNAKEITLLSMCKTLQDGLNLIESIFTNCMQEDVRNTILVLKNYDGQNLEEFRRNLAEYGVVKVTTIDGAAGDLQSLRIEVNAENYKSILDMFKKAIIENCRGFDAKDARFEGAPNEMNIQSCYSDIDLDANNVETEFQSSFETVIKIIKSYLAMTGQGHFKDEEIKIIFNRDILISETEIILNCMNSVGIISNETIVANHPWIDDPQLELKRLEKQKQEELNEYSGIFAERGNQSGANIGNMDRNLHASDKNSKENKGVN